MTEKIVKAGASQFQNFAFNLQKYYALLPTILSQLG
jgi:hypothetical protein